MYQNEKNLCEHTLNVTSVREEKEGIKNQKKRTFNSTPIGADGSVDGW